MENDIQKTIRQIERLRKAERITTFITGCLLVLLIITFIYG